MCGEGDGGRIHEGVGGNGVKEALSQSPGQPSSISASSVRGRVEQSELERAEGIGFAGERGAVDIWAVSHNEAVRVNHRPSSEARRRKISWLRKRTAVEGGKRRECGYRARGSILSFSSYMCSFWIS